ncbi:galactokinase [Actinocorallia sp. A-T 12471]|uniref:galactokinase n=1 Tax=Actinocorallia sp. A-T 12471 TaxID=3089813 RepID=UPI0029CF222F|nr:galactokinase [Actinocorallia sp. A-T 12471]MDX6741136.1 galactokinase [Actinocorallia sp. A-T 12471]
MRAPDAAAFAALFGTAPETAWHAPGRVNLIGEHTDYNGGLVMPFALGLGVTATAARRDGLLELRSVQRPGEYVAVKLDEPSGARGWAAYPVGVWRALRAAGHEVGGAALLLDSDLPQGAGLSSSAAVECAVALALTDLYGLDVPRPDLVRIAQRAENEFVGVPCGILDQSASLLCEDDHALLLNCTTGESRTIPLPMDGFAFLVVDTRAAHDLADGEYATRRTECEQAAHLLGLPTLTELTTDAPDVAVLADRLGVAASDAAVSPADAFDDAAPDGTGLAAGAFVVDAPDVAVLADRLSVAASDAAVSPADAFDDAAPDGTGLAAGAFVADAPDVAVLADRLSVAASDAAVSPADASDDAAPDGTGLAADVPDVPDAPDVPDVAVLARRVRHVVSENRRVGLVADLLGKGRVGEVGKLLTAAHLSLRDDFEVSWAEADATVDAAIEGGACGARMLGGGFGGSVLVLVREGSEDRVRACVEAAYARRGWAAPRFLAAVPAGGARRAELVP